MADDIYAFHKKDLPTLAFPQFESIRRQGKLCDVTLKIGNEKFTAHRIILAATIPYFQAMFTNDMIESKQNEITMQGIEPSALEALVNYAYNGKIFIDPGNVQSILIAASFLHLQVVKEACCEFLKNRFNPSTVLSVRMFAEQYMCQSLVEACDKYIRKHFHHVTDSQEYVELAAEEVSTLLASDELNVSTEEQVFEALLTWVKADEDARAAHLPALLRLVRLPLLTPQYLSDNVASESLIKNVIACRDLLDEAKDYHLMPERRAQLQTFRTCPRVCPEILGIIYAVGGLTSLGDSVSTVETYDPAAGEWTLAQPMETLRSRVGVASLNGDLYAIGGYDGSERLNTVEVYEAVTQKWRRIAPMQNRRSALGAACLDGRLYVCGGYDGVSSLNSVECYTPRYDAWHLVASMIKHRSAAGVTVFDGQIWALGGHDGLSIFDSVECYNNLKNVWVQVSSMTRKRCRLGVAALEGRLYAAGGYDGSCFLKSVERFDPVKNTWEEVAPMTVRRSRVALVADCGKLYAIGGYDGVSNLNSMEVYDPERDAWTPAAGMTRHEGGVGVVVVPRDPSAPPASPPVDSTEPRERPPTPDVT